MAVLRIAFIFVLAIVSLNLRCSISSYERPPPRSPVFISRDQSFGSTSPEQVHISLVENDKMRISWITEDPIQPTVTYATSPGLSNSISATGTSSSYKFIAYNSGNIHNVVIGPLNPSTTYYYLCGPSNSTLFNFTTPPSDFPIKFAVSGDLGQTGWTQTTLEHIAKSNYDVFLLPGDLSYADYNQPLWDSFGRLVEPLASQRPWMVTQGNHEVEELSVNQTFISYNARWQMPYGESASTSNLYYSFQVAGVHIIMLGSYTDFSVGSEQYNWLKSDLSKVDKSTTPWIIAVIHAPWYNSNFAHRGESASVDMKAAMEDLLYNAHVDIVFAGHVHAYERFTQVYKDEADKCGPVHITIGDGGNHEGLATKFIDPQPAESLFREASFGHGTLEVVNASHALWTWHRNDDDEAVVTDQLWLQSLSSRAAEC
ncbi:Purple acid phosphatase [Heracleum sosnowskyi]|uniref:Purple acid phosphatase n=1 Tax=Heracleum sosnowskyi TaxID=360622 RepID=A0AAD8MU68_9APIA|nr:Purple acid phosphatase [Heracleum sosnowskyi]